MAVNFPNVPSHALKTQTVMKETASVMKTCIIVYLNFALKSKSVLPLTSPVWVIECLQMIAFELRVVYFAQQMDAPHYYGKYISCQIMSSDIE